MSKSLKIILAVLLLLCLIKMPYGYYELVRLTAMIGFVILGYELRSKERQVEMIIYFGLALLFQPFLKIALGRELWNLVDVIVGVGLIISIYTKPSAKHLEK